MKGTLHKTDEGWQVSYAIHDMVAKRWTAGKLPLHPDDVKEIEEDSRIFDNIEARIAAYPEVEFEVVKEYTDSHTNQVQKYAKLIKTEYPELEGTMNLCNDITKKRTGKMTEEEWQAAERAQTSTKIAVSSIIWFIDRLSKVIYNPLQTDGYSKAIEKLYAQAIEMHKQEIIDAWNGGDYAYFYSKETGRDFADGSEYYQEKFGLKKVEP